MWPTGGAQSFWRRRRPTVPACRSVDAEAAHHRLRARRKQARPAAAATCCESQKGWAEVLQAGKEGSAAVRPVPRSTGGRSSTTRASRRGRCAPRVPSRAEAGGGGRQAAGAVGADRLGGACTDQLASTSSAARASEVDVRPIPRAGRVGSLLHAGRRPDSRGQRRAARKGKGRGTSS